MNVTLLSNVRQGVFNYCICVRISRMWEFHGKNDEEEIKHLDLVVIDEKGTPMYAEVPPEAIPRLRPHLQEKKIVFMRKIIIEKAKNFFKPVRSPYMIKLNTKTEVIDHKEQPKDFPMYTFVLTPFTELPKYERSNEYFLDVIGRIIALTDAVQVTTSNGMVRTKRLVHLMDLSGNKIEISLWGSRAEEFQGKEVYDIGQQNHVIAIFVGTSVKSYSGGPHFLSGTSACRWYINLADIPEIATFYKSISTQVQPIQKIDLQGVDQMQNMIQETTLLQLRSIDPFDDMNKRFQCTITITKIADNQSWCYPACPRCNSSTKYDGNVYICKKEKTPCSNIIHRYKLCLLATDDTWELEFMLFDERGTTLVGKTAEKLLKEYSRFDTPAEITSLVGEKITVVVKVMTDRSVANPNKDPVFDILNIKKRHGKDPITPTFKKEQHMTFTGTTSSYSIDLPPLVPIQPEKDQQQNFSQALSPHDLQLMDIDQTNLPDVLNISHKRTSDGYNSDEALHTSVDHTTSLFKKQKTR